MPEIGLGIDDLELDLQNPRIPTAPDQREAMARIIGEQGAKLANLAADIIESGLNPMDRLLVVGGENGSGKYTVLEGNRRLVALKVLNTLRCWLTWPLDRHSGLASRRSRPHSTRKPLSLWLATRLPAARKAHAGSNNGTPEKTWVAASSDGMPPPPLVSRAEIKAGTRPCKPWISFWTTAGSPKRRRRP